MRTLLVMLFLAGPALPAWARLGETEKELIARYGEITARTMGNNGNPAAPKSLHFNKGGFHVTATLLDGVCGEEILSKTSGDELKDKEIQTLLDDNAQGHTWKALAPGSWQRDDGASATYNDENALVITSIELIRANGKAVEASRASSLRGF